MDTSDNALVASDAYRNAKRLACRCTIGRAFIFDDVARHMAAISMDDPIKPCRNNDNKCPLLFYVIYKL